MSRPDSKRRAAAAIAACAAARQRRDACADRPLRALLGYIARRKAGQAMRLLAWQNGQNDYAVAEAVAEAVPEPPAVEAFAGGWRVPVSGLRPVTNDLVIFTTPRPAGYAFLPGQAAKLSLGGVTRDYSIVSAPAEPRLEFFVELVPGGAMSERLRGLKAGDVLHLAARPKGDLVLDGGFAHHLMAATVTGVNPFISILRDYQGQGRAGQRFYLLHGASYQDEFGYRDELQSLAAAHPDLLAYLPTVSRPGEPRNAGWNGATGRVETRIAPALARFGLTPQTTVVYACGHPGMVDAVEAQYREQGFTVRTERYF